MKKLLITAIIIMISVCEINAQTLSSAEVKNDVSKILKASYEKMINADVDVKVMATPFAQLSLPDGKVSYKVVSNNNKFMPRDIKQIDLFVNNAFIKTLNLPVQATAYKEVLVAADTISREQAITKECTVVKKVDISQKADYILTDKYLNKEMSAKKSFVKGEIIDKRFVKMKPDVERNAGVRIFFVSNGDVMISIDGTALADGMTGDYVHVENKNYKKVYTGKVIGENRVLVNI